MVGRYALKISSSVRKGRKWASWRATSTREKSFLKPSPSPCIHSDRIDGTPGAGGRQIVDILINNYYSDKDNLRSWTEDHVDAKCALSTLFMAGDVPRDSPLATSSVSPSLFFLRRARRTTNEGIGGRNKMLKWMKEEYGERKRKCTEQNERTLSNDEGKREGDGRQRSENRSQYVTVMVNHW